MGLLALSRKEFNVQSEIKRGWGEGAQSDRTPPLSL